MTGGRDLRVWAAAGAIVGGLALAALLWPRGEPAPTAGFGLGQGAWSPVQAEALIDRLFAPAVAAGFQRVKTLYPDDHAALMTRLAAQAQLSGDVFAFQRAAASGIDALLAEKAVFLPHAPLDDLRAYLSGQGEIARFTQEKLGEAACAALSREGGASLRARLASGDAPADVVAAFSARFAEESFAALTFFKRGESAARRAIVAPQEADWRALGARLRAMETSEPALAALEDATDAPDAALCDGHLALLDALKALEDGPLAETLLPYFAARLSGAARAQN